MKNIAFYAPMKSAAHPVPSGDRAMARALIAALEYAGFSCQVASEFQSRDGSGDLSRQNEILHAAKTEIASVLGDPLASSYDAWVSYHNYYKAPDLIGPHVAKALGIPYLLVEATRARKRLQGPWATFARHAEDASDAAQAIFYLTARDRQALEDYAPKGQKLVHLRPFLNELTLPQPTEGGTGILSVGMFRAGDKLASYRIIAQALTNLHATDWHMTIAGDGPARPQVEALMAPFGGKIRFAGALSDEGMRETYENAAILFWPGVNEAFGMTYLEAQAHSLAVVAQDRPGVRDVLASSGTYPAPEDGPEPLAHHLDTLLADPGACALQGQEGRVYVQANHLLPAAAQQLKNVLKEVTA